MSQLLPNYSATKTKEVSGLWAYETYTNIDNRRYKMIDYQQPKVICLDCGWKGKLNECHQRREKFGKDDYEKRDYCPKCDGVNLDEVRRK